MSLNNKWPDKFWRDYVFILLKGPPVKGPAGIDLNKDSQPYIEETNGEKGVVFFKEIEVAKAYKQTHSLDEYNLCVPGETNDLVSQSVSWWGCNCAYLIMPERRGRISFFRRDITSLKEAEDWEVN